VCECMIGSKFEVSGIRARQCMSESDE